MNIAPAFYKLCEKHEIECKVFLLLVDELPTYITSLRLGDVERL